MIILTLLLFYCLVSYGLTFMVQHATIFDRIRDRLQGLTAMRVACRYHWKVVDGQGGDSYDTEDYQVYLLDYATKYEYTWRQRFVQELVDCSFCVGTWSGLLLGGWTIGLLFALPSPTWALTWPLLVSIPIASALASATIGFFGYVITQRLI